MTEELNARVLDYVRRHHLIGRGETVVVAVSGGADSLCLLHVLRTLAPALECRLHVAHLDHALRPAAAEDAAFVAAQAAELGLPCTVDRRDVGALARRQRISLEAAGRLARYAFFRRVAATIGATAIGATAIATGHTRDDQAETLLLHLARGGGLNGLAGMLPRRHDVIRPLLDVSRAETLAYCAALGVQPRDDESNRSTAFARNRLRHEVLPRLEQIQPAAGAHIARAARLLAADLAFVERLAGRALDAAVKVQSDAGVVLSVAGWTAAEPELRPHMLRLLVSRLLGHAESFDQRHYILMLDALDATTAAATTLTLPRGLVLTRRGDEAMLGTQAPALPSLGSYTLAVPGAITTAAGTLAADLVSAPEEWSGVRPHVAYLDRAAAGPALRVRAWQPGDRVRPLGLGGTRKVQDVFTDRKIPRTLRQRIPIVEGPRGIAWVAGLCTGEAYRVAPGAPAVRLTWDSVPSHLSGLRRPR